MNQTIIDIALTGNVAKAICWTLIHSLWEGGLAAALAGLVILSTRRTKAAIRYNLLTLILLLLVASTAITFVYQVREGGDRATSEALASGTMVRTGAGTGAKNDVGPGMTAEVQFKLARASTFIERVGDYLNTHASVVAGVWLACLVVQLVRLTGGLYQMRRYRRKGVYPPVDGWGERFARLSRRMGIRRKIVLLQSGLINMPVTFGFLKPSILIPLGMMAALPADQLETILLHELAHIRRNDYLANLLIYLTESVFFFNPAIRWIASCIRQEREACCDDIVLSDTVNRHSYFDALIAFQELAGGQGAGRLTLAGTARCSLQMGIGKTDLIWRIRRMLEKENKKLHVMEKTILSVGLVAVLAIGFICLNSWQGPVGHPGTPVVAASGTATDTIPASDGGEKLAFPNISKSTEMDGKKKTCRISATDAEGNKFQLTKVNGEITEMVINGNVLSAEDYGRYLYIFEKIERHREARENDESAEAVAADEPDEDIAPVEGVEAVQALEAMKTAQAAGQENQVKELEALKMAQAAEQEIAVKAQVNSRVKALAALQANAMIVSPEPTIPTVPAVPTVPTTSFDHWTRPVINDLKKNKIIDSDDPLSFSLDKDKLIVNGVQQPEDLFRLFKAKYIHNPKDHFVYMRDGASVSVGVSVE